jgi:hypothetical protein
LVDGVRGKGALGMCGRGGVVSEVVGHIPPRPRIDLWGPRQPQPQEPPNCWEIEAAEVERVARRERGERIWRAVVDVARSSNVAGSPVWSESTVEDGPASVTMSGAELLKGFAIARRLNDAIFGNGAASPNPRRRRDERDG